MDIGAGAEGLRRHLTPGTKYQPVDRVRRSKATLVLDMDSMPLPTGYDIAVAIGLLECLNDVPGFFKRVAASCHTLVFTYHRHRVERPEWVNRYTPDELRALAEAAGFRLNVMGNWKGALIYRARRSRGRHA